MAKINEVKDEIEANELNTVIMMSYFRLLIVER